MNELSKLFSDDESNVDYTAPAITHDDRRGDMRISQNELASSLGKVLDISVSGMRVICRHVPKEEQFEFQLNTSVDPVTVTGKVIWSQRLGFRKHEIGLSFKNASKELIDLVHQCATLDGRVLVESKTTK